MMILCMKTAEMNAGSVARTVVLREPFEATVDTSKCVWMERVEIEHDPAYKQVIPYAVVFDSMGRIACYARHGSEKRLHGVWSCGVGGHVEEQDIAASCFGTVRKGLYRELSEEFSDFSESRCLIDYRGMINEIESELGLCHFGVVFRIMASVERPFHAADELKSLEWLTVDEFLEKPTELWSRMALSLMKEED